MPLYALADAAEMTAAVQQFTDRIHEDATPYDRQVGWQGGGGLYPVYWNPALGVWGLIGEEPDYTWFGFGTDNPAGKNGVGNIIVQFGFVREGMSRRWAGTFARDDQDNAIHLLHSGRIGGGKAGISKATFLAAYGGPTVNAIWPSGAGFNYATLGPLEAPDLMPRVAGFVQAVEQFKASVNAPVATGGL